MAAGAVALAVVTERAGPPGPLEVRLTEPSPVSAPGGPLLGVAPPAPSLVDLVGQALRPFLGGAVAGLAALVVVGGAVALRPIGCGCGATSALERQRAVQARCLALDLTPDELEALEALAAERVAVASRAVEAVGPLAGGARS